MLLRNRRPAGPVIPADAEPDRPLPLLADAGLDRLLHLVGQLEARRGRRNLIPLSGAGFVARREHHAEVPRPATRSGGATAGVGSTPTRSTSTSRGGQPGGDRRLQELAGGPRGPRPYHGGAPRCPAKVPSSARTCARGDRQVERELGGQIPVWRGRARPSVAEQSGHGTNPQSWTKVDIELFAAVNKQPPPYAKGARRGRKFGQAATAALGPA